MVKKAIESLYKGKCTVTEYRKVRDKESGILKPREIVVLKDIPCRLSFKNIYAADLG